MVRLLVIEKDLLSRGDITQSKEDQVTAESAE
jgi:hypothetical protein